MAGETSSAASSSAGYGASSRGHSGSSRGDAWEVMMLAAYGEHDLYTLADPQLIGTSNDVQVRLCPLAKAPQPVLEPVGPFEGAGRPGRWETYTAQDGFHFGSVLYDPELALVRYWYNPAARLTGVFSRRGPLPPALARALAYATSQDGLMWERPTLGLLGDGQPDSPNLVTLAQPPFRTAINASIVPLAPAYAPQRFVAAYYATSNDELYERGIALSFSQDGLHWQSRFPPVLPLDGDRCTLMWDGHHDQFLITSRASEHYNLARRWGRTPKRHIALGRSRDLQHWTPLQTVLEADDQDPEDVELYSMYILPYGHGYLGILEVFHTTTALLENQLTFSRDLLTWHRIGQRAAFLARGEDDAWDGAHICVTMNPPHCEGDELRFWYGGKAAPHWQAGYAALGTATLRRDGFVVAEARGRTGTLTTIPFQVTGWCWLFVNADAAAGELLVEALDEAGDPLAGADLQACVPLGEDGIRAMVRFTGGNAVQHTGRLRLRFHLRNARLYAFKLQNATPIWPEPSRRP
jgi:hypothetical protein